MEGIMAINLPAAICGAKFDFWSGGGLVQFSVVRGRHGHQRRRIWLRRDGDYLKGLCDHLAAGWLRLCFWGRTIRFMFIHNGASVPEPAPGVPMPVGHSFINNVSR
jgi:hypothetical protein